MVFVPPLACEKRRKLRRFFNIIAQFTAFVAAFTSEE
jgi:hypothetical protein